MIVIDEQGNEYEATYPKRAKGLVKNGRARFVGENKICLACPPDKIMEDNKMADNKINDIAKAAKTAAKEANEHTTAFEAEFSKEMNSSASKETKSPTLQEIFQKISELQGEMTNAFSSMVQFTNAIHAVASEDEERDEVCYERISEICEVFKARESNFLKILEIYEKMYSDAQKRLSLI